MDVTSIEFVFEDEDQSDRVGDDELDDEGDDADQSQRVGELCCPACGSVWSVCGGGEAEFITPTDCPHLRFTFAEHANDFDFPGRYSKADLLSDVEPALRALPEMLDEGEDIADALLRSALDSDLWEEVVCRDVDTVFTLTQEGFACGPVSYTVLFGARMKLPADLPPAADAEQ